MCKHGARFKAEFLSYRIMIVIESAPKDLLASFLGSETNTTGGLNSFHNQ